MVSRLNKNMQNSMVFSFHVTDQKYVSRSNLVQKLKNISLKLRFGTRLTRTLQNSIRVFTFSVFDQKYPFWGNLVQKVRNVSLS